MGDEVDFLPADIHQSFLQVDSITLGVSRKACPKNPKQQVYNIFAISHKKVKDEVDLLPADKHQRFLQIDTIILGVACPNYPR